MHTASSTCTPAQVALQGDNCQAPRGYMSTPQTLLRAELGSAFALYESDFPLQLELRSVNSSMRGRDVLNGTAVSHPQLFFTFWTDRLKWSDRCLSKFSQDTKLTGVGSLVAPQATACPHPFCPPCLAR